MVQLGRLARVEIFQWKTNCFCTHTDKILSRKKRGHSSLTENFTSFLLISIAKIGLLNHLGVYLKVHRTEHR